MAVKASHKGMAENREEASKVLALFLHKDEAKYPQATECLEKDWE